MNIAMIHFRVGETDGVSLEMDKWKKILEKNGHNVYYIAGSQGTSKAFVIEDIKLDNAYWLNKECFEKLEKFDKDSLKKTIINESKKIKDQFVKFFQDYKIDLIVPNNIFCLGSGPHIAMGLTQAAKKANAKVVCHHHDFYWERSYFSHPTTQYVKELLETYYPPNLPNTKHAVINSLAKNDLLKKKGFSACVVPNAFDFHGEPWKEDDFNSTYRQDLGVSDNQVIFLQATRVTNRKAIELAVDLIALLNEPRFKNQLVGKTLYNGKLFTEDTEFILVLIGLHEGGDGYENKLIQYANDKQIKIIVKPDLVDHSRHHKNGKKIYSLWDSYIHCDIITYPSIYEGWGNQFLEGLFSKKPQIVFEYSVFESDIKNYGFDYISMGNQYKTKENGLVSIPDNILEKAANKTIQYLIDKELYSKSGEKNYQIAKKYLSLKSLEKIIMPLFDFG